MLSLALQFLLSFHGLSNDSPVGILLNNLLKQKGSYIKNQICIIALQIYHQSLITAYTYKVPHRSR